MSTWTCFLVSHSVVLVLSNPPASLTRRLSTCVGLGVDSLPGHCTLRRGRARRHLADTIGLPPRARPRHAPARRPTQARRGLWARRAEPLRSDIISLLGLAPYFVSRDGCNKAIRKRPALITRSLAQSARVRSRGPWVSELGSCSASAMASGLADKRAAACFLCVCIALARAKWSGANLEAQQCE